MRLALLVLLLASTLAATSIRASYDINFAIFGKIGEAVLTFSTYGRFYHIRAEARLTGAAARLGRHRREVHESFGTIEHGVLKAELYKKQRRSDRKHEETYYVLYPDGKIEKYQFRDNAHEESFFDISTMRLMAKLVKTHDSSIQEQPYRSHDDLLSLFFNVRTFLGGISEGSQESRTAAGARGEEGELLITNPAGEKRALLASLMPENNDRFVTVVINQDIFESERGELFVNLDEEYLAKEAMLKDVILFGDIRAVRTSQVGSLGEE